MNNISYVPLEEIRRIRALGDPLVRSALFADLARLNILYMIMRAGSGHIGTSFSSIDIMSYLWLEHMRLPNEGGDIFFSSKGHDAPALYATLIGLEKLDFALIEGLRRLGGLPGHPDVGTPFLVANTGSLGMGISKARGMAKAARLKGEQRRFYVLTGDGELQEGQFWESLQPTANGGFGEITVIVDHNKIQSDLRVTETSDLGDLEQKIRAFGWDVYRGDGHDFSFIADTLRACANTSDTPQLIIADTVKGKGVSFMERIADDGFYKYHSGAPKYDEYVRARAELVERVNSVLENSGEPPVVLRDAVLPEKIIPSSPERLVVAYGDELVKIASERSDVVALDADLVLDTGLIPFKNAYPDRYIEAGIAEQDMVSMAGGLALAGMLPVVHSFACFLSTRPNEQIYNNATEQTKIVYVGSLAGLIPATPGHSHQSVRDVSLLGSVPGLTLIQPSNEKEARMAIRWAIEKNEESTYIRLVSIPIDIPFVLPEEYTLVKGRGVAIRHGKDAAIIAYGPVMLTEAIRAADLLAGRGKSIAVYNFPWLNYLDEGWIRECFSIYATTVIVDDHYLAFSASTLFENALRAASLGGHIIRLGLTEIPACGAAGEVLEHHHLNAQSIADAIS